MDFGPLVKVTSTSRLSVTLSNFPQNILILSFFFCWVRNNVYIIFRRRVFLYTNVIIINLMDVINH